MATWRAGGGSFNTTTGTHTNAPTPQVGDYCVLFAFETGITTTPTVSDNNADGFGAGWSLVDSEVKASSADKMFVFVRDAFIGSATSTTFSVTGASSSGGGFIIAFVAGMFRAGTAGVRQSESQASSTAVPTVTLPQAILTSNIALGGLFTTEVGTPVTEPSGWTERSELTYSSPSTREQVSTRDSGETNSVIAWQTSVGVSYCAVVVELNASTLIDTDYVGFIPI